MVRLSVGCDRSSGDNRLASGHEPANRGNSNEFGQSPGSTSKSGQGKVHRTEWPRKVVLGVSPQILIRNNFSQ